MTALTALGARGLLATFQDAGVLGVADVHVARRVGRLAGEESEAVLLAVALTVRAVRTGSVCVELRRLREVLVEDLDPATLPWPDPAELLMALRRSPLVVGGPRGALRPLRLVDTDGGELLYLDRYFRQEQTIRQVLADRDRTAPPLDLDALRTALPAGPAPDRQRLATAVAATRWTTVIAGGPGTGKTHTVAALLRLLLVQHPDARVALAAPTGKAAARLQEEVRELDLPAVTLHRLLGARPGRSRFRHDAANRLPFDVVVVDECSMVSLTLMARLLDAVRPDARLVLVGDPDQLASVDAGAVLADLVERPAPVGGLDALEALVGPDLAATGEQALAPRDRERLAGGVVRLSRGHRFGGRIAELAAAVRDGDGDHAVELLEGGGEEISFVAPHDLDGVREQVVASARVVTAAAEAGDLDGALAGLERHRLLCAHREGPWGVSEWDRRAREWISADQGRVLTDQAYAGQPLLVLENDHDARVYNGDTGVVVRDGDQLWAAFSRAGAPLRLHPARLGAVRPVYAMTIHRSQGSQYDVVTVVLPELRSALLSRELLYTAITRATRQVRILGTPESVRHGVQQRVQRASGLRRVLAQPGEIG
jgi:exodeoxyribonuclease V alpha subunit